MKLSDNLKRIRKENDLSQEQLAEKLGVSRQAVSKWESGQSYPEMDKVLLICKTFNYNIDDLMNENIKEIEEEKEAKAITNQRIKSFFNAITKVNNVLKKMTSKELIKCIIEQIIIIALLIGAGIIIVRFATIITLVIGGIIDSILGTSIFLIGTFGETSFVHTLFISLYIALVIIAGVAILSHIFKIRYLDYYNGTKEDKKKENTSKESKNIKTEIIKEEKVIIREPEHSVSKILTDLMKPVMLGIEVIAGLVSVIFIISFIALIAMLVLSFTIVKSGVLFVGVFLFIVSLLIINFIVLEAFYDFITTKKSKRKRITIMFLIALVLAGISTGLIIIGMTKFDYTNEEKVVNDLQTEYNIDMEEGLLLTSPIYKIEYVETDLENIKIIVKHSKYYGAGLVTDFITSSKEISISQKDRNFIDVLKYIIDSINNKELLRDYYSPEVYVYASKENIEKLKQSEEAQRRKEREKMEEYANYANEKVRSIEERIKGTN